MSGNSGAWGVVMWQNNKSNVIDEEFVPSHEQGIALSGGDAVDEFLEAEIVGCLVSPPDGLGVPPVRSGDVTFAQRDGVQQFGDYYEPRILTFDVSVCNDGCPGCPTGRQKVKRLTKEWSRSCSSASLVLFPDCYDPEATEEEKTYLGPYLVTGRPRVAELTWLSSDVGCARLTLRFDADDARLILADTSGFEWTGTHTEAAAAGAASGGNIAQNYRLDGLTMTEEGATVDDTTFTLGAPDGGSYFSRTIIAPNTSSPMTMVIAGTGTDGIPVTAGTDYTVSWWAQMDPVGAVTAQADITWYDGAGVLISTSSGTPVNPGTTWQRFSQTHTAPVGAEFMAPALLWSGTALAGQQLDFAQAWINEGAVATDPATVEVVGDLCAFPVFRLDGPLTGPITIFYGAFSFTYDENIAANEQVTIDTQWGRASSLSGDQTQNLLGAYDFPLAPGMNDFSFTTGDPADTGSVQIEWQNAVISG